MQNLEVYLFDADSESEERRILTENRYVIGSDRGQRGDPGYLWLNSGTVLANHVELVRSYTGWQLINHGSGVRLRGRALAAGAKSPLNGGSEIEIGEHVVRITEPHQTFLSTRDLPAERLDMPSVERQIHIDLVDLIRGPRLPGNATGEDEFADYRRLVEDELDRLIHDALGRVSDRELVDLAGTAIKRRLIARCISSGSRKRIMEQFSALGPRDTDLLRDIERDLISELGIQMLPKETREDMERLHAAFDDGYGMISGSIRPDLRRRLVHDTVRQSILSLYFGLGPLQPLLENDQIGEIMICRHDQIFVEKAGKLIETGLSFASEDALLSIIENIMGDVGKRVNQGNPYEDARLADGSRVNAVVPPVAVKGPALTIRKFASSPLTLERLLSFGSLSPQMASFLKSCVHGEQNVVISGGTGTGKTTMLNWLATHIPETERLVTVEDTAELQLLQTHVVTLEARPPNPDGKGAVTIRDLVKNALRMRPDRIIVGECRGGESFDMLQAMNTGHDGSMTTAHANSPVEMIARLENLVMMAGEELPIQAIRHQIAHAIDVIIQLRRFPNGARRIVEIAEVGEVDPETGMVEVDPIYRFVEESHYEPDPRFIFCGHTPRNLEQLMRAGLEPATLG